MRAGHREPNNFRFVNNSGVSHAWLQAAQAGGLFKPKESPTMSSLIRRPTQPPVLQPDQLLNAQVMEAERVGVAAVARLQAGAFATSVALQNATMLSRAANAAFRVSPMSEDIYQSILMAYGSLAVTEIQALGMQGRGRS